MIGRSDPSVGRGANFAALMARVLRRRRLRIGWLNHVRTRFCQSLWKWTLGITLLCFMLVDVADAQDRRSWQWIESAK